MSFPRHLMTSVELKSVTQSRTSGDYIPGNRKEQWHIGTSLIFTNALGIAGSKDSFWSMDTVQPGYYGNNTREPYNRLQSLVLSMSNGPIAFGDQIGYSNVSLIMRCCNTEGLLLRPSNAATSIDKFFVSRSFEDESLGPSGEVWSSNSIIGSNEYNRYIQVFSAVLINEYELTINDILYNYDDKSQLINNGMDMNYIYYENNSTNILKIFNKTNPILLHKSNKHTFEWFTLIPINPYTNNNWLLMGELNKWIKISPQRFTNIIIDNDTLNVIIYGAINETVIIGFVNKITLIKQEITCIIGKTQYVSITMPNGQCVPYS